MTYTGRKFAASENLRGVAFQSYIGCRILAPMSERRTYLKEWRKFRGYTQTQVLDRLAVFEDERIPRTAASLSRIENGEQIYTQRILEALAAVYAVDEPGWLLDRNPNAEGKVLDLVSRLNERQQVQAIAILETFLKAGNAE